VGKSFKFTIIKSMLLKKIFVIFILLQGFLFFAPFVEAAPLPPAVNPICWTLEGCKSQLKETYPKESFDAKYNFQSGGVNGECGNTYGLCIPGQKVKAQIRIGNFDVFENMADFFQKYFIYVVSIGGFIAATILVMAGFTWATSAGSPERITQAKGYITSSLTGSVLLLGSYTLLYTINPDLVRFRLPMVYMLRPIVQGAEWCKDLQGANTMVAQKDGKASSMEVTPAAFNIPVNPTLTPEKLKSVAPSAYPLCNTPYFWKDSNEQTCRGHVCSLLADGTPRVCSNVNAKGIVTGYGCKPGILSGSVTSPDNAIPYPFLSSISFYSKTISAGLRMASFCKTTGIDQIFDALLTDTKAGAEQRYLFSSGAGLDSMAEGCSNAEENLGFFLIANVNDKLVGKTELALADLQPVGKTGNGICSTNLFLAAGLKPQVLTFLEPSKKLAESELSKSFDKVKNYLFTLDELKMGTICDIELSRSSFPSL